MQNSFPHALQNSAEPLGGSGRKTPLGTLDGTLQLITYVGEPIGRARGRGHDAVLPHIMGRISCAAERYGLNGRENGREPGGSPGERGVRRSGARKRRRMKDLEAARQVQNRRQREVSEKQVMLDFSSNLC